MLRRVQDYLLKHGPISAESAGFLPEHGRISAESAGFLPEHGQTSAGSLRVSFWKPEEASHAAGFRCRQAPPLLRSSSVFPRTGS